MIWTSYAISLLGIWLMAAPATFGFTRGPLIYSDWVLGLLLFILGWLSRRAKTGYLPWTIGLVGIYLQFAPLLFWAKEAASYLNDTMVGALAIAFSLLIPKLPYQNLDEEKSIPPGWSYNPSSWPQRLPIAFLIFLCWMISRYLAAFELGYIDTAWDPFFQGGTIKVLTSTISRDFPLPDAGLGAFAYTLEFLSTCQGGKARWRTEPWLVLAFGLLVVPVGFISVSLIILQPLSVGTWCTLCLSTAVLMLLAIPFAIDEVAASLQYLRHAKEKPFLPLLFKGGACPKAKEDTKTAPLDAPLASLLHSARRGITFPWNLVSTIFLGILLMAAPRLFQETDLIKDLDPIIGAFTIVFSVIAFSEVTRKVRYMVTLFGFSLLASAVFLFQELALSIILFHFATGALLIFLSMGKGHFYERTTYQEQ